MGTCWKRNRVAELVADGRLITNPKASGRNKNRRRRCGRLPRGNWSRHDNGRRSGAGRSSCGWHGSSQDARWDARRSRRLRNHPSRHSRGKRSKRRGHRSSCSGTCGCRRAQAPAYRLCSMWT